MARPHAILFDFFGTLVTYEADRTLLRYDATHALLAGWGCALTHDEFVAVWDGASSRVEAATDETLVEVTMDEAAAAFGIDAGLDLDDERRRELIDVFLGEWEAPVRAVAGVDGLLRDLAVDHRLAVVSNTHDPAMVPRLLDRMGVADLFDDVLLSVDHGVRKPHPSIYAAALERLGCEPADALFVGDSFDADYAGPTDAGMSALLIDPDRRHDVPEAARLHTVLDLAERLAQL